MYENEPGSQLTAPIDTPAAQVEAQSPQPQLSSETVLKQFSIESRKLSVLPGIIGALIGSLLGVLFWVILGQIGFIAGICGWIMIRGAIYGYGKLAGGIDRRGKILSTVIALLMPFLAEYISLAVTVYRTFRESYGISIADAFRSLPSFLAEPDVLQGIIFNLLIGYALIGFSFIQIKPKQQTPHQSKLPRL